jgi:hypothetical protein
MINLQKEEIATSIKFFLLFLKRYFLISIFLNFFRNSKPKERAIEYSVDYFSDETLPKRVYEFNKEMKLILIIRNPVTRIISHFTHLLANKKIKITGNSNITFEKQVNFIIKNINNNDVKNSIVRRCKYAYNYKQWLKYFPREQILILNGENFIVDPYQEIKKVEEFLNLKKFYLKKNFIFDKAKGFYCIRKNEKQKPTCLGSDKGNNIEIPITH